MSKINKVNYRIETKDGRVKFAGTDFPSWFTLEAAQKYAEPGEKIFAYNMDYPDRPMWEVC